jgi:GMP reductase
MRIESDVKLDFANVLIRPKRSTLSSRAEVDLHRTFTFRHTGTTWTGVPVMAANMDTTGTFEMAAELAKHHMVTCLHKYQSKAAWTEFAQAHPEALPFVAVTGGISEVDFDMVSWVVNSFPTIGFICLDIANGYQEVFVDAVRRVRKAFPTIPLIAGNVVTNDMTEELILAGADIVKIGIGPGSVCTTRVKSGVGFPQLSAVIECADAAHGLNGLIVSDGGCTVPGDVSKAFGGGADWVMLGGMFAGHDESGGDLEVDDDGQKFKTFYGMSSTTAMNKYSGGVAKYRAAEGKTVRVKYRGPVNDTVQEILGGVRSTCTYVGAKQLKELSKRTTFIRVTQQVNNIFE